MIRYLKAAPTTWVMQFKGSALTREGPGLSFLYFEPTTTIVQVPMGSVDVPFAFTEVTKDFQQVTVQGQLTFRVAEPKKVAALLDFSTTAQGAYRSDDPQKLPERLVYAAQILTRSSLQQWALRDGLTRSDTLERAVLEGLRAAEAVRQLGVEVLQVSVLAVRPTPEMARALEAEAREALQRQSDEAIYERRTAAVEQERRVKQSELETEVMVEQQRRHIRETKMAADIAMEKEREKLLEQKAANERTLADAQAYTLDKTLGPIRALDFKTLQALSQTRMDPASLIALSFRELAENAQKIGELNMSPDLLKSLLQPALPSGK
ncbi:MAG: SPFH domain-containing protein [Myxococcaceae bacterium]|jgi:regulator of protease activity HflC (stomatin/prohibitin superfamily)|nr:SPFH domain-containing protein [Myxococcaceae bacterium]MCA3013273.1 SPFH domain-containing protein [Myxococcaceae bacterium]